MLELPERGLLGERVTFFLAQTPVNRRAETEPENEHEPHHGNQVMIPREYACVKHRREVIDGYGCQTEDGRHKTGVVPSFETHVEEY